MSRDPHARRLAAAVAVSVVVHAAAVGALGLRFDVRITPRPRYVPVGVVEAPSPPPPPAPPPPRPPPKSPPPPKAARPARVRSPLAASTRARVEAERAAGRDAGSRDAGALDGGAGDGGVLDAGVPDALSDAGVDAGTAAHVAARATDGGPAGDGGLVAARDAGAARVAAARGDAGPGRPAVDPATVDLRPYLPVGERVMLVLRLDRLRGTPWAAPVDAVLAPMPDYRTILAGTGVAIVDAFETLVVASPEPRDVTATFLAARTTRPQKALRELLARPAPGSRAARVVWSTGPAGAIGRRVDPLVRRLRDPRVFFVPHPGWMLLVRPEEIPALVARSPDPEAARPAWLQQLVDVEAQAGTGPDGPIAVVMLADLPFTSVTLPGLPMLPVPASVTFAVNAEPRGLVVTGVATHRDAATARAFHDALVAARGRALGNIALRLLLRRFHADGAVRRLTLRHDGEHVTFSTSLRADEAARALETAAAWSTSYFLGPGSPPGPAPKTTD